jgi:predicted ArsR family transcriptional regulator
MSTAGLGKRFLESTRGRILALLRRSSQTVEELAARVGLTDNAVRSHLSTLERDGLVRQEGLRRAEGPGKPATVYEIHPEAEPLFSRAYAPMLGALLDELAERMTPERRVELLQAAGRRLAANAPRHRSDEPIEVRARAGADLLNLLGGDAQVEHHDGAVSIRGCGCPLSVATSERPEVCRAVESLLTEMLGVPVRETCDRGGRPRCCFRIDSAA